MYSSELRERWLHIAAEKMPALRRRTKRARRIVEGRECPEAFQGWEMVAAGDADKLGELTWKLGQSFTLDFGEHLVGYLEFDLSADAIVDAPVRLQLIFGEIPAEVCVPFEPFQAGLSRSWLQDETVNIDQPSRVVLPRRYAFRYVKITVTGASPWSVLRMGRVTCKAVSSASVKSSLKPPAGLPEDVQKLDAVSLRTLANCMQTVFEDGPKRDRRLWMGDLRLQALVNYVSFRNFDLVKRCLYLFAGLAREDGVLSACVYEVPVPRTGLNFILDYAALFLPTLLEYAEASGDWETARDLWPVAWQQMQHAHEYVDAAGLFHDPGDYWLFIDWRDKLHKETPLQGVIIYALRAAVKLATRLGDNAHATELRARVELMTAAAQQKRLSPDKQLFISGPEGQVSWASQVWMILAEVVSADEGRALLQRVAADPDAVRPAGPYLYHFVVEAMLQVGLTAEACAILRDYWGDMIRQGATTFWEVHDPSDQLLSPYGNHLINSYCHAWSCTPAYFIRTYPEVFKR